MAESEEELKSLLMKVKEESEKVGLKPSWWFISHLSPQQSRVGFLADRRPVLLHKHFSSLISHLIGKHGTSQSKLARQVQIPRGEQASSS